jgi:uncharacterized protein (DUF849 family)
VRTGLEDVIVVRDGSPAADNAALVRAVAAMVALRWRLITGGSRSPGDGGAAADAAALE